MSVPTYASNGQLSVQGIHATNVNNTPILTSFPSGPTGTSTGHYHFTEASTNAIQHLNVSSNKEGGHQFYNVSSTTAPEKYLDINKDRALFYSSIRNPTNKVVINFLEDKMNIFNSSSQETQINSNTVSARSNSTSENSRLQPDNVACSNDITQSSSTLTPTFVGVNDNINSLNSRLTTTDLTFNGVSLVSTVNTLSSDVSGLITDVSGNTYDIGQLQTDVSQLQTDVSQLQTDVSGNTYDISVINGKLPKMVVNNLTFSSPAIYADSSVPPQQNSTFQNTYSFFGWAYKKVSPQASNAKINWYFPPPINNMTVGDLKGLYYQIFNNCSSSGSLPFLVVYTKPTGSGDYASWYHSSMTYVPDTNSSPNQSCQMYVNIKNEPFTPQSIGIQNQINMVESSVNNPKGVYADDQQILSISFQTNSASALNTVDFACTKIGMVLDNYSAEFLLL
jgi:hypothetical protein